MLAMSGAVLLWSSSVVGTKLIVNDLAIGEIMIGRFACGALILWVAVLVTRQRFRLADIGWRPLLMGCIEPGLVTALMIVGLLYTSAVSAALIFGLMPLVQPFTGRIVLKEPIRAGVLVGAVIAVAGTALYVAGRGGEEGSLIGDALILLGVVLACTNQLLARRVAQTKGRAVVVSAFQLSAASLVGVLVLFVIEGRTTVLAAADDETLLALAYLGVFATAGPFFLYNVALRSLPVGRASLFTCLLAPLAAPLSAAVLGTTVTVLDLAAIAVVTVGIIAPPVIDRWVPARFSFVPR